MFDGRAQEVDNVSRDRTQWTWLQPEHFVYSMMLGFDQ